MNASADGHIIIISPRAARTRLSLSQGLLQLVWPHILILLVSMGSPPLGTRHGGTPQGIKIFLTMTSINNIPNSRRSIAFSPPLNRRFAASFFFLHHS